MRNPVRVVALVSLLCVLCHTIAAQNWHFSNGWESGKRSAGLNDCQFRPQVKALVNRIIDEEITRLQRVCTRSTYPLQDTRPYLPDGFPPLFYLVLPHRDDLPKTPSKPSHPVTLY